jgi:hypothetical protein
MMMMMIIIIIIIIIIIYLFSFPPEVHRLCALSVVFLVRNF